MNWLRSALIPLTLFTFSSQNSVRAQDWPQWLGPNRNGSAPDFKAPASWPKELRQVWKTPVGEGVATPALVGNRLYVASRQEGREITRCLDAATGKEIWKDEYDSLGATGPAASYSGPRSSPAVANGKVVTLGVRGVLSCLDAATGKVLWRKDDLAGAWPRFFVSSSPLIAGSFCIAQRGGGESGAVIAYDLNTGEEVWTESGKPPAYSSLTLSASNVVIAQTEAAILALDLPSGKVLWETAFTVQGRGYNAATPILDGPNLIFAGSGRGVTAVKLVRAGDKITGTELWKNADNSVQFNSPIFNGDRVFGLSAGNDLFCIHAVDGKTLWTAPLSPPAPAAAQPAPAPPEAQAQQPAGRRSGGGGRGAGYGSLVSAGNVVLALSPSSELVVFDAKASSYKELARIKVADSPTYAYPVLSGNRLFIKDQNSVTLWSF